MTSQQQAPPAVDPSTNLHQADWSLPLAVVGTVAGAALGVLAFWGLYANGLYSIMLPGALAGLGGGYPLRRKSIGMGVLAAIVGLVAMLLTEWRFFPGKHGQTLGGFLLHLPDAGRITLIMLVLGVLFAYWFGTGRDAKA
ncbi:MAG TPA: hypothetical protein VMP01_24160 [Pirellulaceae bacterium]|nr:hypothetical protein [Pirellulaceae bacterium]